MIISKVHGVVYE